MSTTLSIIGTSGRTHKHPLTASLYEKMVNKAEEFLETITGQIELVSGGAAWSDHVAVTLFLKRSDVRLTIHSPCEFDVVKGTYKDSGVVNFRTNPGGTSNYYYRTFSEVMGREMRVELVEAIRKGATVTTSKKGFHARNSDVAKSDVLLAFTWESNGPETGGTYDTWKKAKGEKHYVDLNGLV